MDKRRDNARVTLVISATCAAILCLTEQTHGMGVWQWVVAHAPQGNATVWAGWPSGSGAYAVGETVWTSNVDMLTIALDATGGVRWLDIRGSAGADSATGVSEDDVGNTYVCGACSGGFDGQGAIGSGDYALVSYRPDGSRRWTRIYGTPAYDAALALTCGGDGTLYVVGTTEDRFGTSVRGGASDVFLAAHDTNGVQRWAVSRGTATDDWATAVHAVGGYVYVGGVTLGALDGGPAYGDLDCFVMCFTTNGTWQWTRQFGTNENDVLTALSVGDDGRVYATGATYGEFVGAGRKRDILIARITSGGVIEYVRALGTTEDDAGLVLQAGGGGLYVGGWTYGVFPSASSGGGADFVVLECTTNAVLQSAYQAGAENEVGMGGGAQGGEMTLAGCTVGTDGVSTRAVAGKFVIPEAGLSVVLLVVAAMLGMRRFGGRVCGIFLLGLLLSGGVAYATAVEDYTNQRGRMILNGIWQFKPALNAAGQTAAGTWGTIWVPGSWRLRSSFPHIASVGSGPAWAGFGDGRALTVGWYRTNVKLPPHWQGRGLSLELRRVATDARVFVNGVECGAIEWPFGTVEITHAARRSPVLDIRILVIAHDVVTNDTTLGFGLIGEVFLHSHPRGPRVTDVFVKPSVRQWRLGLDIELSGLQTTGMVMVTPRAYNEAGVPEKAFASVTLAVTGIPMVVVTTNWPWSNPRLWDLDQPNLYTLRVTVSGCGIQDEYAQRFGFREFWIEGRYFKLNGTPFRWRPALPPYEGPDYGAVYGIIESIDGQLRSMRAAGFNIAEFWPTDEDRRGKIYFRDLWYERADELGFPVIGSIIPGNRYFSTWAETNWFYRQRLARHIKRLRNYPSVLMWITSANVGFNTQQDQNPRYLGRFADLYTGTALQDAGLEQIAMIKAFDPTRPATTHHGGCVGDVHTANHYLNLLPLQDRTEWLSVWATNADMPFCSIEFGTPFFCTMLRGRAGFNSARYTEPLVTEFAAIYMGRAAYTAEVAAYRSDIRNKFVSGQTYGDWNGDPDIDSAPPFQSVLVLFNTHTYRSWRGWNFSGGMIPWNDGYGWFRSFDSSTLSNLTFYPGRRGAYLPTIQARYLRPYEPPYNPIRPSGMALMANNSDTLAWIGGVSNQFTERGHLFFTNEVIAKAIVLHNDTRTNQVYTFSWVVTNNNMYVAGGSGSGSAGPGTTTFVPFSFTTPATLPLDKTAGAIYLHATIGTNQHRDVLPFRVFHAW